MEQNKETMNGRWWSRRTAKMLQTLSRGRLIRNALGSTKLSPRCSRRNQKRRSKTGQREVGRGLVKAVGGIVRGVCLEALQAVPVIVPIFFPIWEGGKKHYATFRRSTYWRKPPPGVPWLGIREKDVRNTSLWYWNVSETRMSVK